MSGTSNLPIRIIILDAYALIRAGLRLILEKQAGFKVVGEAGDSSQGLKIAADMKPDIILLKLNPDGDPGLGVISQLLQICKNARIILMTTNDDRQFVYRPFKKEC